MELPSLYTGNETARTMIVSPDILAVVTPPFAETELGDRYQEFRQWLDNFSESGQIAVSQDPRHKPPDTMLARVDPTSDEFWSIRVTDPEDTPGIRAFGAFAGKDTFIALTWDLRESIADAFDDEVSAVREAWRDVFGAQPPFSGGSLDEYLSNYLEV